MGANLRRLNRQVAFIAVALAIGHFAHAGDCSWTSLGPQGGPILSLAIDPKTPDVLYAGTQSGGVYKSANGGASWNAVSKGLTDSPITELAIDPTTSETIYACTGRLYKSTDSGGSWNSIELGISLADTRTLAIDPSAPHILFAGGSRGIYKSIDSGGTWNIIGLQQESVRSLLIDPTTPKTLYAHTFYHEQIFKSTDAGVTWNPVNKGLANVRIISIAMDPMTPKTLYAATDLGVFKSTDGGGSWTATNLKENISSLAVGPTTPRTVYAARIGYYPLGSTLYKSTDDGATWSSTAQFAGVALQALAIRPTEPQILYAGTSGPTTESSVPSNGGLLKSIDGGVSWAPANGGLANTGVQALVLESEKGQTMYAGMLGGVSRKTDGSTEWVSINSGLQDESRGARDVRTLAMDPTNSKTLYAGLYGFNSQGVYKSTNGGTTWSGAGTCSGGPYTTFVAALAIDPVSPQTIYAGTKWGVCKSTDGANSWAWVYKGMPDPGRYGISVVALGIDPMSTRTVYAGLQGWGLYKSADGGSSWSSVYKINAGTLSSLAIDPITPNILYIGTVGGGVVKSIDGGTTWTPVNKGLSNLSVYSLIIDPTSPQTLYAGTSGGGVYRSANAGNDWDPIGISQTSSAVTALAVNPKAPQTVYAGTFGGGVWSSNCACAAPGKPVLISPSGETNSTPAYSWHATTGAEWYMLWVNDSTANRKIQKWYTSEQAGCASGIGDCSVSSETTLATGPGTWWIQGWNSCDGGGYGPWSDGMKFTVSSAGIPGKATLLSPSGTVTTTTPAYTWNAVPSSSWYQLWVNSSSGTPKIQTWYSATQAQCASGNGTCTVTPTTYLAADSYQWWVQTWNNSGAGPWSDGMRFTVSTIDAGIAEITSPVPFSTLASTVLPFTWTAGTGISQYWLSLGTTIGSKDIYNEDQKTNLSALVQKLPNDGSTIFASIWSLKNGDWKCNNYAYKACTGCGSMLAAITSPAPGSVLTSTTVTFNWNAGAGVSQFWLSIGKSLGSSEIYSKDQGASLSATVSNLPSDGSTIYVRLWSNIIGYWAFSDYTFLAAGK